MTAAFPGHDIGVMWAAMKAGRRRALRTLRGWAISAALMVSLLILLLAVWAALERYRLVSITAAALVGSTFLVGLIVVLGFSWRIIGHAAAPPEYREALANGLATTAEVLEVETTGWRSGRNMDLKLRVSPRRYEYTIRLRVSRPDMACYEAEATAFLATPDVPRTGTVIPVRVHPERPDVVVLDSPRTIQA